MVFLCFYRQTAMPYYIYSVRQWPKISIFAPVGKTMRWIEKCLKLYRIGTTSIQSLGSIKQRAQAERAKMVFFV